MELRVNNKDEIVMKLVHYFVTEENYEPITVGGVKNEVWLENLNSPYPIIRINSNYIHNTDQLKFDIFKVKNIVKQIKKKTLSLKMNTLNILLDLNEDVNINEDKDVETYKITNVEDISKNKIITSFFPNLTKVTNEEENTFDFVIKITNEINNKTNETNTEHENIFKPKKIILTKVLITINVIMFILSMVNPQMFNLLVLYPEGVKAGEYWRLITAAFLHADMFHLLINMYSLNIIGTQIETFLGKTKYLIIYFGSAITASLMSAVLTQGYSVGASGALFGLLGALVYFGYHFRIYLGSVLKTNVLPIIAVNLLIGFLIPQIDNAGHIGGLIGGLFIAMAVGINSKTDKASKINGIILSGILIAFLCYMLLVR